jgi:hypothetical protein
MRRIVAWARENAATKRREISQFSMSARTQTAII